tara:strand:+ start:750 stop:1034 length:285 start_codon:yes stop_codon:yes gene_type:complete
MKILEAQYGLLEGKIVQINEAQYILQGIQGFTATLADPNDPRVTFRLNLADKKIDTTGAGGMISITDELTPAERANLIRGAKGAMIDVNVSSLR